MLFWTVMVICVITYIFAIVGVVLISSELRSHIDSSEGNVDPELVELMGLFDGIFNTMQTLIQVLLLDSVRWLVLALCLRLRIYGSDRPPEPCHRSYCRQRQ